MTRSYLRWLPFIHAQFGEGSLTLLLHKSTQTTLEVGDVSVPPLQASERGMCYNVKTSRDFADIKVTQLLLHLFVPLPTPALLPLTVLSHRIYTIILRILHNRLVAAAELESHSLLLECFHPSAKLTEPAYFCAYQGTDGLSPYQNPTIPTHATTARLGEMRQMYSRFRPHRRELEDGGRRVARRPGDIPGSRTYPGTVQDNFRGEVVKQTVSLEAHELFTQLVAQINLVKIRPYNGLFSAFVDVEEGVLRVWRKWLGETAAKSQDKGKDVQKENVEEIGRYTEAVRVDVEERFDSEDKRILWVSPAKNTGIRFNVKERRIRRDAPILIRNDEDLPVSYDIEYDGRFSHWIYLPHY